MTELVESLAAALGPGVERRETHMSWVLLTGDRAYKLKKPVEFGFLDLRDPDARRRACEEEVRVNAALAADVVLGVLPVVRGDDGVRVGGDGEPVDWVVEMRRFDEDATMAALVAEGRLEPASVVAAARRIAAFHAEAERARPAAWAADVERTWRSNLDELAEVAAEHVAPDRVAAAGRCAEGFLRRRAGELERRAAEGRVVDGHGDMRADHVLVRPEGITIVDRLEFDPALRRVDVADDLAFLVMDLQARGARSAADALVAAYGDAGGDPGDAGLVAAFAAYRAQVRAKVGLLRAAQLPPAEAEEERGRALALVRLAEQLAWTARGPVTLVVAGPPASGKSTVAASLAEAGDLPVLSSDVVRKEMLGVAPGEAAPPAAYEPEARREVYAVLGERTAAALRRRSVVVDATFGDEGLRDAFLGALGPADLAALRVVVCEAPAAVREERARARAAAGAGASDAGPEVVRMLAATTAELPVGAERRLTVDGTAPPSEAAARVAAWLDVGSYRAP